MSLWIAQSGIDNNTTIKKIFEKEIKLTINIRLSVSAKLNINIPPRPIICSVLRPTLSMMAAETNVINTLTPPDPIVAYSALACDKFAFSNILVE